MPDGNDQNNDGMPPGALFHYIFSTTQGIAFVRGTTNEQLCIVYRNKKQSHEL
jgi:hypothetical protein